MGHQMRWKVGPLSLWVLAVCGLPLSAYSQRIDGVFRKGAVWGMSPQVNSFGDTTQRGFVQTIPLPTSIKGFTFFVKHEVGDSTFFVSMEDAPVGLSRDGAPTGLRWRTPERVNAVGVHAGGLLVLPRSTHSYYSIYATPETLSEWTRPQAVFSILNGPDFTLPAKSRSAIAQLLREAHAGERAGNPAEK